ncbi:MAG: hypothetical protein AKCLJLPJ_02471 [Fimbriimonadales bacterium]|nr:hypothetical protein [Fimbriimonadales bacterium]
MRPKDGRWQTVDPLWPSEPVYGYADENPVSLSDPSGLLTAGERDKWRRLRRHPGYTDPEDWKSWWWYGEFCGSANVKPPGLGYKPIDCLDACCWAHDRCLEGHYFWGYSEQCAHRCCDCMLLYCARGIRGSKCCPVFSVCWIAADQLIDAFSGLCTYYLAFFGCPDCLDKPYRFAHKYWYNPPPAAPKPTACPLE